MSLVLDFTEADVERFWAKVQKADNQSCWHWLSYKNKKGYGVFRFIGKVVHAHRVSWMIHKGSIPNLLCVCHTCDTPSCVNPNHLWLGTNADNNRDRDAKGRRRDAYGDRNGSRTHPESRPRGEKNTNAKLTENKVRQIRSRYANEKITLRQLAVEFGMSKSMIAYVKNGEYWKHVS